MKYAVEMISVAMIYILNYIHIGSGIQMLIRGGQAHRQQVDLLSLILFFPK
jgi:hypothetical protein